MTKKEGRLRRLSDAPRPAALVHAFCSHDRVRANRPGDFAPFIRVPHAPQVLPILWLWIVLQSGKLLMRLFAAGVAASDREIRLITLNLSRDTCSRGSSHGGWSNP